MVANGETHEQMIRRLADVCESVYVSPNVPHSKDRWLDVAEAVYTIHHTALKEAFERGRIAEAKECEKAKRHDEKAVLTSFRDEVVSALPQEYILKTPVTHHARTNSFGKAIEVECPTPEICGYGYKVVDSERNRTIETVRKAIQTISERHHL